MDESEIDHHIFKSYIVISGLLLYIFLIMSLTVDMHNDNFRPTVGELAK